MYACEYVHARCQKLNCLRVNYVHANIHTRIVTTVGSHRGNVNTKLPQGGMLAVLYLIHINCDIPANTSVGQLIVINDTKLNNVLNNKLITTKD